MLIVLWTTVALGFIRLRIFAPFCTGHISHQQHKGLKSMTETLEHGYLSESTQQELSSEYQHEKVKMVFKNLCDL